MIITSLYGMTTLAQSKKQKEKLQAAIEYLGNKYLLAVSIKKGNV
jgi:hypothetical protein